MNPDNNNQSKNKIHLVACGVLSLDMKPVSERLGVNFSTTYLEGGLHDNPAELRRRLQSAIDAEDEHGHDFIAIGYGICGRGSVGIRARRTPLVIPRVHDCISLFLGSDEAYRRQFAQCPGTYYISAGWYEEKVQPKSGSEHVEDKRNEDAKDHRYEYLLEKYGEENADEITRFLTSWQRNYNRAVFIDTGVGKKRKYGQYAKAMAEEFGWQYQQIDGSLTLLEKIIRADPADGDILIVPPGFITLYDSRVRKLIAAPEADRSALKIKTSRTYGGAGSAGQRPAQPEESPAHAGEQKMEQLAESPAHAESPAQPPRLPGKKRDVSVRSARAEREPESQSRRLGLGIDAGGTYTDVVIYDFQNREVLDKGKALTTKWDYTVGIDNALAQLDERWFDRIDLVSVSTTLATNAIVEQTGQNTGLLLMPAIPVSPDEFNSPSAVIRGRMDISGNEVEPIDEDEIRQAARKMIRGHEVKAIAISGYGGSVNPAHELAAKDIIIDETGLEVCCGHELSDLLDFRVRANTAVLNAGIIPLLERFLEDVEHGLAGRGILASMMVVKGDGTLMNAAYAKEHPVETILSGPAASIAGARYLTECRDATIVDVGGTTSDIGKVKAGSVSVCPKGAMVGRFRTHVRAIDMHTLGLGGDSEVFSEKQEMRVGPRRIAPVCWLASQRDCVSVLEYLGRHIDDFALDTRNAQIFVITGRKPNFSLSGQEERVLAALSPGPQALGQLVEQTGCGHVALLQLKRLEQEFIVQRCGLTPTDLLHVNGKVELWDERSASDYADIIGEAAGFETAHFMERIFTLISEKLIFELVKSQLSLENTGESLEDTPTGKALFDNLLKADNEDFVIRAELKRPVIGLGAAAEYFLREPALHLSAELRVPEHADVANAIGAITSMVHVARRGSIRPSPEGMYLLGGVPGNLKFVDFEEASENLVSILREEVCELAQSAGTEEDDVKFDIDDRLSTTADGAEIFLERSVVAAITGLPVSL